MKRDTTIVAAFVSAVPLLVLTAATFCSYAIAHGASVRWRLLFRIFCHGMPTRSLDLFGVPMPICARCTGIYIGLLFGIVTFMILPWLNERLLRIAMYTTALPIGIDGITQAMRLRESTNALRIATGFAAAFTFGMWTLSAIERKQSDAVSAS